LILLRVPRTKAEDITEHYIAKTLLHNKAPQKESRAMLFNMKYSFTLLNNRQIYIFPD